METEQTHLAVSEKRLFFISYSLYDLVTQVQLHFIFISVVNRKVVAWEQRAAWMSVYVHQGEGGMNCMHNTLTHTGELHQHFGNTAAVVQSRRTDYELQQESQYFSDTAFFAEERENAGRGGKGKKLLLTSLMQYSQTLICLSEAESRGGEGGL